MTKKQLGSILMWLGIACIFGSATLVVHNNHVDEKAKVEAESILMRVEKQRPITNATVVQDIDTGTLTITDTADYTRKMPEIVVDAHSYIGSLEIPTLNLALPILDEWNEADSKVAPCRYVGAINDGNLIIAGHNYKSHFRRLSTLQTGDIVRFTDVDGTVISYCVNELLTLNKFDTAEMVSGDWDLTLFTCTLSRQDRVVVRCIRM